MDVATFCELAFFGSVPIVGCDDDVGGFLDDLTTHLPSTTFTIVTTEAAVPTSGTTSTVGAVPPNPAWPTDPKPIEQTANTFVTRNTSRPLYGGGSGVCVYSVQVYIVF